MIVRSTNVQAALRSRQRGFLLNPFRFGGGGGGADPYWANVSSLLHFDGADGSTAIVDVKGRAWTAYGNAQLDTAQAAFGPSSLLLDGTANTRIVSENHADFGFDSGDYTVEGFIRFSNTADARCLFDNRGASAQGIGIYHNITGSGNVYLNRLSLANNSTVIAGASSTQFSAASLFQHWAVCKQGTTVRGFIAGLVVWSVTDSRTLATTASCTIGAAYTAAQPSIAHHDETRITKGVARYTANFTPPSAAFPDA